MPKKAGQSRGRSTAGEYQNASEAIRDALRVLQQRRKEDALRLKALRAEVAARIAALDRGPRSRPSIAALDRGARSRRSIAALDRGQFTDVEEADLRNSSEVC